MDNIKIAIPAGESRTLLTKGKLCNKDIEITAGSDYDDGYQSGYDEGYLNGWDDGYYYGWDDGYMEGEDFGYTVGKAEGIEEGKTEGKAEGKAEGIEEGKQEAYDAFWDSFQQNGNRTHYGYAFLRWAADIYAPKYPMKPTNTSYMYNGTTIPDLKLAGVLDMSDVTSVQWMFASSAIESIDVVDFSHTNSDLTGVFYCANKLHTIGKLILKSDGTSAINTSAWDETIASCTALENITIEGLIGKSISFKESPKLTNASVQSIIDHLKDMTGLAAQTLTFHATVGGNLTAEQKAAISAKNWTLVY